MGTVKRTLPERAIAPSLAHRHGARVRVRTPEEKRRAIEIGGRIRAARESTGLNATVFARTAGVDRNSVGRWEKGKSIPEALHLEAIASTARVSIDWLVSGETTPEWTTAIATWRAETPRATDDAVLFIRSLPLAGYRPSSTFLDIALLAFEKGLTPQQVVGVARETETARQI